MFLSNTDLKSVRILAIEAVKRIEQDKGYTDLVLDSVIKRYSLSGRDAAFLNEIVRGTIRWKKKLDWIVNQKFIGKIKKIPLTVRWILWLGIYQILFTNIPPHAAVNESVNLTRQKQYMRWVGVVNAILRNLLRNPDSVKYPNPEKYPVQHISITQSHPEWLVKSWINQLGVTETLQLCQINNQPATVTVRVNTNKIQCYEMEKEFENSAIAFKSVHLSGYYHIVENKPEILAEFLQNGLLSIQDESAGLPVRWLDVYPGNVILDLCGAPGSKAAALAECSKDSGIILCGDIRPARAGLIRNTIKRLELKAMYTVLADAEYFPAELADIVILDAPCSGLGTMQRKPDIRWQRKESDVKRLTYIQKRLLKAAAKHVRAGGQLIYSTCTVTREENEEIVNDFLSHDTGFSQAKDRGEIPEDFFTKDNFVRSWPHKHGIDGSFAAKLIREKE